MKLDEIFQIKRQILKLFFKRFFLSLFKKKLYNIILPPKLSDWDVITKYMFIYWSRSNTYLQFTHTVTNCIPSRLIILKNFRGMRITKITANYTCTLYMQVVNFSSIFCLIDMYRDVQKVFVSVIFKKKIQSIIVQFLSTNAEINVLSYTFCTSIIIL